MTKNGVATLCIIISWPICLLHRFINSWPPLTVKPIIFDKSIAFDLQWVLADNANMLSQILFIFGVWLVIKKISEYLYIAVTGILIISIIDVIHYWLWFKRNEYIVFIEFLIILFVIRKIFKKLGYLPIK